MDHARFNPLLRRALAHVQSGTTDMADQQLAIPLDYYRRDDQEIRERAAIWEAEPLVLATTAQLAKPHDFIVRTVLGKSILIVRGGDGTVRAFENYCRHRGARPAQGCGNSRLFICPYHAWSYDSSGRLRGQPGKDAFDTPPSDLDLVALPCTERHGLIWVRTVPGPLLDIRAHLSDELDDELACWPYPTSALYPPMAATVAANWKTVVENFGESYHFATVHGRSIPGELLVSNCMVHDAMGPHHRLVFPSKTILELATKPEAEWDHRLHATIVYWIFPGTIIVNVGIVAQIIELLPIDRNTTEIQTVSLGFDPHAGSEQTSQRDYIVQSARQAIFEEDGPVLDNLGSGTCHSSQSAYLVGRNEIGVQHMVRSIAGKLGYDLSSQPSVGRMSAGWPAAGDKPDTKGLNAAA